MSHKERLALACGYIEAKDQLREQLMSLTKDKTGGGAGKINKVLNKYKINLDELRFQSYDYTPCCLDASVYDLWLASMYHFRKLTLKYI